MMRVAWLRLAAGLSLAAAALFAPLVQAASASITSTPANGTHYVTGEAITTRLNHERLSGGSTHLGRMRLDIGGVTRQASSTTSFTSGMTQVNFSYTVTADDVDTNGISIPANSIDTQGNNWLAWGIPVRNADLSHGALNDQAAHKVIGSAAAISSTNPSSLTDANLDGATLSVGLTGTTFGSGVTAASFELVTTIPSGLSISGLSGAASGEATATLTLSFTGSISTSQTLAVKVLNAAHAGGLDLTTGTVTVQVGEPPPPAEPPPPIGPPGAPSNLPPVAVGEFEDLSLDPGERLEIPLSDKFRDPEGGALTYSAGTSNARVAEVGVSGRQFWVRGYSPGSARVFVAATDAGGLRTFQHFLVQVGMVVSFAADASAPEGETLRLRLVASQPADEDLSVAYALIATGDTVSAADGFDHDGGSGGTATIAAGEMEAEIEIGILDDAQVEPPREFFALSLSPPAANAGYVLGFKTQALATIEEGVCDRSAAVRDALRGRDSCTAVTDLSSLLALNMAESGAEALSAGDFLGLSRLRVLDLSRNRLSSWPSAALAGLPNLISLRLNGNRLRELPAGALAAHPRLTGLHLAGNALSSLPPGAFRELAGLRRLDLSGNALAELPGDALAGLSGLWMLRLNGNLLSTLPAGLFAGVSGLRELQLQDNPGAPFVLGLQLARTDAEPWAPGPASVAARVAYGAPFALHSVLKAVPGEADATATTTVFQGGIALSVPGGADSTATTTVLQGEADLVWVRLDGTPPVPDEKCELADGVFVPCFHGIVTAVGSPLALFKRPPMPVGAVEPMELRVDGDALQLDLASQFEAASEEALTYAAESSDPSAVRVRIENGTLIVEAVGEGVATITIRATDGDGLSATLRFVVQAQSTARNRSRWRGWRLILLKPEGDVAR